MREPSDLPFLKALLEKSGQKESLVSFFPDSWISALEKKEPLEDLTAFLSSRAWIEDIHYSWLYPILKSMPRRLQLAYVSLLPTAQSKGISQLLKLPEESIKPSQFSAFFFMNFLRKKIIPEKMPSRRQLPESPMNILLFLDKHELIHLIDLLGIYDLAQDVRQIVDKNLLEKIHASLSKEMRLFLDYCLKQPIKWISPKINLQNWDGSKKQLEMILHQRGLFRLARSLIGEAESFKWHLFHRLDTGRVKIMENLLKQKIEPAQAHLFKRQVLDLANRFKK